MKVYFITLALISFFLMIYSYRGTGRRMKAFLLIVVAAILIFVAGFRYRVGTDYVNYYENYYIYKIKGLRFLSQPGLTIVAIIASWIYDDPATWFLLMSVITIVPVIKTIHKQSCAVALSVLMFLLLGCWHYSFNLVKQSVAAAIMFAAYPAIRDRKLVRWGIACAVGAMFHSSALLMIPIYFLTDTKITPRRMVLIVLTGLVVMFSYDTLIDLMDMLKQDGGAVSRKWALNGISVNSLRILVNCVPVIVFFVLHRRYNIQDPDFAVLFNLSLINAMFNVGSMHSIYINRFCVYTNLFNVLFIPELFKPLKTKLTFWIPPVATILYFAFWAYDLYKGSTTVIFNWVFNR